MSNKEALSVGRIDRARTLSRLSATVLGSVGSIQYRNYWVRQPDGAFVDVLKDGTEGCAAFVSNVLYQHGLIKSAHATVRSTTHDLLNSGWQTEEYPYRDSLQPYDVLLWQPAYTSDTMSFGHLGFVVSATEAVSNSSSQRRIIRHSLDWTFPPRTIMRIFRLPNAGQ